MILKLRNKLNSGWQVLEHYDYEGNCVRWTNIKKRALNQSYVLDYNQTTDDEAREKALNVLTGGRHNDEWVSETWDRVEAQA